MVLYKIVWRMQGFCGSLVEADSLEEAKRRASPGDIDQEQIDELEWTIVDVLPRTEEECVKEAEEEWI